MRELFDRLRTGGAAAFEGLREQRVEEDLQLDFKRKARPDQPNLNNEDKSRIGEALSGFSNSAGGLLVLGVDCRNGADGVDCVQGVEPFLGPTKIASDIKSMLGSLLQPSNDGIEIVAVPSVEQPDHGYVLILVPRSERRPHQSRASGHFKYFKRMGRDFHPMEHYDVDDAFSRKSAPHLIVQFNPSYASQRGNQLYLQYEVHLINDSDVMAKYPFVYFRAMHGVGIYQADPTLNRYKIYAGMREGSLTGGADDVLHPETRVDIGRLAVVMNRDAAPNSPWRMMEERSPRDNPSFAYTFGCEGMRVERGDWTVDRSQLAIPR